MSVSLNITSHSYRILYMKKYYLIIIAIHTLFFLQGCATMNEPISQHKPGRIEYFEKRFQGKDLTYVYNELGSPASQGHWGLMDQSFMLVYPIGVDPTIPTWLFNSDRKNEIRRCYILLFDKTNNKIFSSIKEDVCYGFGNEPDRIDWEFIKKNGKK